MQNTAQGTLQVKFGNDLFQGGFTAVPNFLLKLFAELGITPNELVFLLQVWMYWYEQQQDMFPALSTIAERMGITRRQLRAHVSSLKKKKYQDMETGYVSKPYLQVRERYAQNGGQLSNQYDFSGLLEAVAYLAKKKGLIADTASQAASAHHGNYFAQTDKQKNSHGGRQNVASKKDEFEENEFEEDEDSSKKPEKEEVKGEQAQPLQPKPAKIEFTHAEEGSKLPKRTIGKKQTEQSKLAYIGKPLTQEEINEKRKQGKNASGYTPLTQIPPDHWQKLEADARNAPISQNGIHYNNCTKKAPVFIDTTIEQFTTFLGDEPENTARNINRTAKLYRQLEMSEEDFRAKLYEAFDQARRYPTASIQKKRSDGKANRMPVFFAILEERAAQEE